MGKPTPTPKVSVCIVAYNQRQFIGACIDSLLDQDCGFPYEIIVSDDASTDGTADLVRQYAERHPGVVVPLLHAKNLGPTQNLITVHNAARGEFVAHLDGDDLAYPSKLRRQVEVLEAHPECAVAAHDVDLIDGDGTLLEGSYRPGFPLFADLEYLVRQGGTYFIPSSEMYRRSSRITTDAKGRLLIDYFFHIEHAAAGGIAWLPDRLGAYRLHVGYSSNKANFDHLAQATELAFQHALELGCSPQAVAQGRVHARYHTAVKYLVNGNVEGFRRAIPLRLRDYGRASWRHILLSLARNSDLALRLALKTRIKRRPARKGPATAPPT